MYWGKGSRSIIVSMDYVGKRCWCMCVYVYIYICVCV